MKTKLQVSYNVDKLSLIYQIPITFFNDIARGNPLSDYIYGATTSTVFICTQKYSRIQRTVPSYTLSYMSGAESIVIGEFRNDIQDSITLDVENRFLYSGQLYKLYEFEQTYSLRFSYIKYLDVCCDSNQNLPRKFNAIMHSPECGVSRRGGKKELTAKGNQQLGVKIMDNLKTLTSTERPPVSYYFYMKPSGCRRSIILRGYDKRHEIEHASHKTYISDALGYSEAIHRMEVATYWCELTQQAKCKRGWSHKYIYDHITDITFLRDFFIRYIDRFYTLKINDKKTSVSKFLCLDWTYKSYLNIWYIE